MNFEDIQNVVNEWVWDKDEKTYFFILDVDIETRIIKARGLNGLETEFFFSPRKLFSHAQKV